MSTYDYFNRKKKLSLMMISYIDLNVILLYDNDTQLIDVVKQLQMQLK